jgi:outer membrane protein insertion porin family
MRRLPFRFLSIVLTSFTVLVLHAQAPLQPVAKSAKIAAITVTGAADFPADQIVAASGLKPGDVVTTEQIQAAADRLAALGLFMMVNYRFTSKGDAINLEFQVQEAATVPISFENFPWLTDDEIAAAIRQDVGLFTGAAPTGGTLLDAITDSIGRLLDTRRIPGNITHQLVPRAVGDGMMMQFHLEGSTVMVHSVQLGDALAANSEKLKDRISDIQGHPYSRFAIDLFENEQILPLYQAAGHFEVKLGVPQPHVNGNPADSGGETVDLLVPISPGQIYTWNGVTWQGNAALLSGTLDGLVGIKTGEVIDGTRIEDTWQHVILEYGKRGYLDTTVFPQPAVDESTHRVSYHVTITEGAQYHMGELVITGLSVDAERLLVRSWQIPHGQIFDNAYYQSLLKVLAKPSVEIFGDLPVHYTVFGHFLRPDTSNHVVDVLLDFK